MSFQETDGRPAEPDRDPLIAFDRFSPERIREIAQRMNGRDPELWRNWAQFFLKEIAGLTVDEIGLIFGIHRGNATRAIQKSKRDSRRELAQRKLFEPAEIFPAADQPSKAKSAQ